MRDQQLDNMQNPCIINDMQRRHPKQHPGCARVLQALTGGYCSVNDLSQSTGYTPRHIRSNILPLLMDRGAVIRHLVGREYRYTRT